MNELILSYPEILAGQEFLTEVDPKQVKLRVFDESLNQVEQEISRLTSIIYELNRCPQSLSEAESNLKTLHQKYSAISSFARDYSIPELKVSQKVDELLHGLTLEMSYLFKRYVKQLDENTQWIINFQKKAAFAVNGAIYYLSLLKVETYCLNEALPSYIWRELNLLYQLAEKKKLLTHKAKFKADGLYHPCGNAQQAYARAAMVSAISPYELSRQEHWNLFYYLQSYAENIKIEKQHDFSKEAKCFVVDLAAADKPTLVDESGVNPSDSNRFIKVQAFVARIQKQLSDLLTSGDLPKNAFINGIDQLSAKKLFNKLVEYCSQHKMRESHRYPIQVEATAVFGFSNLIQLMQRKDMVDSSAYLNEALETLLQDKHLLPFTWQTVNESRGGLCMQQLSKQSLELPQSMPLMLKKYQNGVVADEWTFALTRWHKFENKTNQAGINFILGDIELVDLMQTDKKQALLIRQPKSERVFLLTSPEVLKDKKVVGLELTATKQVVHCKKRMSCYGADLVQIELTVKNKAES